MHAARRSSKASTALGFRAHGVSRGPRGRRRGGCTGTDAAWVARGWLRGARLGSRGGWRSGGGAVGRREKETGRPGRGGDGGRRLRTGRSTLVVDVVVRPRRRQPSRHATAVRGVG